jgi:hypothetical protein
LFVILWRRMVLWTQVLPSGRLKNNFGEVDDATF